MKIEKLIEELRTKSLCSEKANLEIMDLCMEAAAQLERINDFSNSQMEVLLAENSALKAIINEPENAIHRRALHEVSQVKAENAALKARLDKAVELPCKIGDKLYFVDIHEGEIYKEAEFCGLGLYWTNDTDIGGYIPLSVIGKTVFLSREAAEGKDAQDGC